MKTLEKNQENGAHDLSVSDLLNRQSVRATFRLSPEVIDLLGIIAGQLGVQQKSVLDQLVEDTALLSKLASDAGTASSRRDGCRQKTYVMSRSSLNALNTISRRKKIPRDTLVEISVRRLLPVMETELEKHYKRKLVYKDMQEHLHQGVQLREKARDLLEVDDPVLEMIDREVTISKKNIAAVRSIIAKGTPMEQRRTAR